MKEDDRLSICYTTKDEAKSFPSSLDKLESFTKESVRRKEDRPTIQHSTRKHQSLLQNKDNNDEGFLFEDSWRIMTCAKDSLAVLITLYHEKGRSAKERNSSSSYEPFVREEYLKQVQISRKDQPKTTCKVLLKPNFPSAMSK